MHPVSLITKALADDNRLRMLMALRGRELCVCQIMEMFHLAPSTVSKHMWILRTAGLVEARKDGRWVYYRLAAKGALAAVREALRWVSASLRDDPRIRDDSRHLEEVVKLDLEALCRAQLRRRAAGAAPASRGRVLLRKRR